ncbi:stationary phase inducible protein CsiE [Erwinia psidii]|uniref:Stationary phase inducible protein CsiE n=1 Tax=Erwinia psidii TaxID=69224 RepID=A0A3N6SML3_9GAMM|nr:stationary phase inducible protein CsiE [Erwinia psidii]MCX8956798.1 stationary phase inducible protein CsiE [Erwinia psidii]MCX8960390.1 stationary phase inducible protein CsiE [Erwinia psidii]MCX8964427.1 stationary phase inducible protein CsiE [Erwinia psidii]RQM40121.1 stationary phase inducible protein CsiE [Erwinia psidii]
MSLSVPDPSAFSSPQRQSHLLLLLYLPQTTVTLASLSELNRVDQSVTRQDIAEVATEIQRYHRLVLNEDTRGNYRIDGAELDQRLCLLHWLRRALRVTPDFVQHHFAPAVKQQLNALGIGKALYDEHNLQALVHYCANQLSRDFSERDRQFLPLFMQHSLGRRAHIEFSNAQLYWLSARPEHQVALKVVRHWQKRCKVAPDDSEVMLFALVFSQLCTPVADNICHEHERRLLSAVRQMIADFQKLSAMRFSDEQGLCAQLYTHLSQAMERSLFAIGIDNGLTEEVVRLYPRLLRTARQTVADIEQLYKLHFTLEEVALIAIIFGAWLMQENALQEKQVLLLTGKDRQLEIDVEQQLRELTLLPLNIKYLDVEAYQRDSAPGGIALVISPYATSLPLYSPPLIHAELPLQSHHQERIRMLLES